MIWMHNTNARAPLFRGLSLSLERERVHARVRAPLCGGKRRKLDEEDEDEDEETKKTLLATAFSSHRSLRDAS